MAIQLSAEQERVVGREIHAGLIREPDDVVGIGIETIRQRRESRETAADTLDAAEWPRHLHEWISSHSTTTPVLSEDTMIRDSIYGARGAQSEDGQLSRAQSH